MRPLIKSWSYSAYSAWKKCAYRFATVKRLGIREPMSYPIRMGIELHRKAEFYLKGDVSVLPPQLRSFTQRYKTLRKLGPVVEEFWGVSDKWKPLRRDSWVVMKMDSAVEPSKKTDGWLLIQDLKTGNWDPDHEDQADLYATIGMAKFPDAVGVEVEMWYSKTGLADRFVFPAEHQRRRVERWKERGSKLLDPKQKYHKSPTDNACRWCPIRSDKYRDEGACDAWKSLRSVSTYRS